MIQWILEHQHVTIHAIGTILLGLSELLALRKDPSKAKGIIDAVLKLLKREPKL